MRARARPRSPLATIALTAAPWPVCWSGAAPAARAQRTDPERPTVENVRIGFTDSIQGRYKVGTWTPVWIDLQGGRSPFRGQIEITAPDDDGTPTAIRFPAFLQAREVRTFAAIRPAGNARRPRSRSACSTRKGRPVGTARPRLVDTRANGAVHPAPPRSRHSERLARGGRAAEVPQRADARRSWSSPRSTAGRASGTASTASARS